MVTISPTQQQAIQESTRSLNLWYGSVSSGKTTAWLLMMLGEIQTAGPSGALVIMGKSMDAIWQNVFVPLLTEPFFAAAAPHIHYRQRQPMARIFGRDVMVIGINDVGAEGRIRGATYQKVFYDELTLCPEPVFNMLWSRMRAPGPPVNPTPPRIFATTNPDTSTHYLRTRFIDRPEETDTYARLFTMDDNPGLSEDYKQRVKASYTGLFYKRFILGEWVAAEGAVYEGWDQETMTGPLPDGVEVMAVGLDYGTQHPSAAHALSVSPSGGLWLSHEWSPNPGARRLTDAELADSLQEWLADLPNPPRFIYADPAAASFREELKRRGVITHKADNAVVPGIRTVDSLLGSGDLHVADTCRGLIGEIPGYRWDAKATEKGKDAPVKEKDDHCDSMRYVVRSTRHLWGRMVKSVAS